MKKIINVQISKEEGNAKSTELDGETSLMVSKELSLGKCIRVLVHVDVLQPKPKVTDAFDVLRQMQRKTDFLPSEK